MTTTRKAATTKAAANRNILFWSDTWGALEKRSDVGSSFFGSKGNSVKKGF
jgi:hypothetical protein